MLDASAIADIARPILSRAVAPSKLQRLDVAETSDTEGQSAIQVVAVADAIEAKTVDARADAFASLQRALQAAGEARHAFVRYVAPDWLIDEPESDD